MGEVSNKLWKGEYLRATIKFSASIEYVVYSLPSLREDGSFIKSAKFSFSEGNNRVNPLGIATSNTVSLEVYDAEDRLSPINKESPYNAYLVNGIEIDIAISYDGVTWKPYGKYYTTSWSGSYSEGWHGLVAIGTEDILNTLGNLPMPQVEVFYNSTVEDIVTQVLSLTDLELTYKVSPDINQTLGIFAPTGSKVRDFLNNLCQLLLARVVVDREGALNFIPSLGFMMDYKTITLGGEYAGALTNQNTSNINYNNIRVKYLEGGEASRQSIFTHTQDLQTGANTVGPLPLRYQAISIEDLNISYENTSTNPSIEDIAFTGSQTNITINLNVKNGPIYNVEFKGWGVIVSTVEKEVTIPIPNTSIIGGTTFEFKTQQMMDQTSASQIAENLANYIKTIQREVNMKDTALTPELYTGDQLILQNTGTIYDGVYKITHISLTFSENYSLTLRLVRLGDIVNTEGGSIEGGSV